MESSKTSRRDFIKNTACLAACPFILSALNSCGSGSDTGTEETVSEQSFSSSEYDSMKVGEVKALPLTGLKNGALIYKRGDKDFLAFTATCPHEHEKVGTNGVCTSGHGGSFDLATGTGKTSPVSGRQLQTLKLTYNDGKITIQ